jgi:hypothetical protein
MKKTSLLTFLLFGLFQTARLQNDSLEQAILSYENKQLTLVRNGRDMLQAHILAGDIEKSSSLLHYLETQVENEDYMAFYDFEKWLLHVWTGQYHKVLPVFRNLSDSALWFAPRRSIPPPEDLLLDKLVESVERDSGSIFEKLDNSNLPDIEREFLKLFTSWLLCTSKTPRFEKEEALNKASNQYLTDFPKSDFRYFVGRYINQEEVLAKRGMDFEFFSGYGGYTGSLNAYFGHHVPFGVAFDFYYKKWIFGVRDHIGIGKLDKPIVAKNTTWDKPRNFNHTILELNAAYEIYDSERLKIFPFVGITFGDISPPLAKIEKFPALENVGTGFVTAPIGGLNVDWKFGGPNSSKPMFIDGYGILRFRLGYMLTNFVKKQPNLDGNSLYFTIGFGGVVRKVVKRYQ